MKVCVLGLGYIGLPTASFLATKGFEVDGVDVNSSVVDTINRGEVHIYEPSLDILLKSAVQSGRLKAHTSPTKADIYIVAVPTPFRENHLPDLSYVESATRTLAPYLSDKSLVILESTSPVGTTERMAEIIAEKRPDLHVPKFRSQQAAPSSKPSIYLAHCPERVLPGQILKELVENDRIIGGIDGPSTEIACNFYRSFVNGQIFPTDSRTAELTKLVENSFRDVNIAYANELSLICDKIDINVFELISLANRHPRVNILQPGPGVGGHCIAVDPWFIVATAPEEARLIRTAREVNDFKPHYILKKILEKAAKFKNPTIACLGIAFKPNIDDLRESPSLEIVKSLAEKNIGQVLVVEPNIKQLPSSLTKLGSNKLFLVSLEKALEEADIVVLLVDHTPFYGVSAEILKEKVVIDTRGVWKSTTHT
ncbi:MAG: UDP-N-acetyl-D-mannosamine dehydrogenase [Oligoflexales bacterium]|nr:UDP-N-acetyl-D-mannosamine dehydrogenase [Oligoflexales bacterium]